MAARSGVLGRLPSAWARLCSSVEVASSSSTRAACFDAEGVANVEIRSAATSSGRATADPCPGRTAAMVEGADASLASASARCVARDAEAAPPTFAASTSPSRRRPRVTGPWSSSSSSPSNAVATISGSSSVGWNGAAGLHHHHQHHHHHHQHHHHHHHLAMMTMMARRGFLTDFTMGDTSKVYQERRLMGWPQEDVYRVISEVERYRQFVPWCVGSTVLRRRQDGAYLEAELAVGFQALSERYTSRVTLEAPRRVHSSVADSRLFDHLESTWRLSPGPRPGTTWLSFHVDFAFRSALHRHVADLFFDQVARRMMSAFEGRCAQLYGPSALAAPGRRGAGAKATATAATAAVQGSQTAGGLERQQQHQQQQGQVMAADEQRRVERQQQREQQEQQRADRSLSLTGPSTSTSRHHEALEHAPSRDR